MSSNCMMSCSLSGKKSHSYQSDHFIIMFHAILVIIIVILILNHVYKRYKFACLINQMPMIRASLFGTGIRGIFGVARMQSSSSSSSVSGISETLYRMCEGLPHAFPEGLMCTWIGPVPYVFVTSAELAEQLLKNKEITKKAGIVRFLSPILGHGLFTSHGDEWNRKRKLLTPAFHSKILEKLLPVVNHHSRVFLDKIETEAFGNNKIVHNISPKVLLCTLDVIAETAMGERMHAQSDGDGKYAHMIHEMGDTFVERSINPLLHPDFFFTRSKIGRKFMENVKWTQEYTESVIRKRTEEIRRESFTLNSDKNNKDPFMTILIREHMSNSNSTQEAEICIRDEVNTFVIAGHDSTGWATVWAIYLLGLHPESQEKIFEEVIKIIGEEKDRHLTFEEVKHSLPFTEAVVKESLRLFPSIPFFTRVTESETKLRNYTIPAGVQVIINVIAIHRNKRHWHQPQKFNPERFLDSNEKNRNPFSFLPFSAGVRNCIGQKFAMIEMKALLVNLCRRYKFTSLDHRDKILVTCSPTLKTRSPIRMRFEKRRDRTCE